MAEFISIAAFNDRTPAEQLAERLRAAGYESEVFDESMEQKWHLMQLRPHAHMRVRVAESESERALQQVAEWSKQGLFPDAIRCPECGSTRVEYPQFSRRTILGSLPAIAAATGMIERDYYCEACHYTWPAEPEKPGPELDRLNWPKKP
ncbi:MAG TPA: SPOR domain-containing protein [Chthoniobacteraceae bacterium]|nr:SPOR domain-containing protein [Chthoniobacteraceae bacterium]